jgi:hypothetical protein
LSRRLVCQTHLANQLKSIIIQGVFDSPAPLASNSARIARKSSGFSPNCLCGVVFVHGARLSFALFAVALQVQLSPRSANAQSVVTWGYNAFGQLGDGTLDDRRSQVSVVGLSGPITAVAAGGLHSLAVKNGALYAWGENGFGQLGEGLGLEPFPTEDCRETPLAVVGMTTGVSAIAAGFDHTWAGGDLRRQYSQSHSRELASQKKTDCVDMLPTK